MVNCHEMRKGQVYKCEECGLRLRVIEECRDCGTPAESCRHTECRFVCCDKELELEK